MVEPIIVSGAVAGAKVSSGFFLNPLGRVNLIITGVLFAVLIVVGIFQSVEQHSILPLLDNTVFKIVSADTQIGEAVDSLESSARPLKPSSVVSKEFPPYLWFWIKFWSSIIINLYFIYFFLWLIYGFWYSMNSSLVARNVIFAIVSFLIISVFVGMIFYNMRLSGMCLPENKAVNFQTQMSNAYPLHGTIRLVQHTFNKDLFFKIGSWTTDNGFGQMISNIPSSNVSVNVSGVALNGT